MKYSNQSSSRRVQEMIGMEAAEWLIRLDCAHSSSDDRVEFTVWLTTSPMHVSEFLHAKMVWEALSGKSLKDFPDRATLLEELRNAGSAPVSHLHDSSVIFDVRAHATSHQYRGGKLAASIAIVAILFTAALFSSHMLNRDHATYTTAVGEQRSHTLSDGTTVTLNTRSRVRLDWSARNRDIYLESGEALFEVAHDSSRPFRVWTGDSITRAVGTLFNVHRTAEGDTVTVLKGRVEVTARVASPHSTSAAHVSESTPAQVVSTGTAATPYATQAQVQLGVGEQAHVSGSNSIKTERLTHPELSIAWEERRLIFSAIPLAEVVAEFNRYNEHPLRIDDATLAGKNIDGVFNANDRASLVAFLEEFEGVYAEVTPDAILLRRRTPKSEESEKRTSIRNEPASR